MSELNSEAVIVKIKTRPNGDIKSIWQYLNNSDENADRKKISLPIWLLVILLYGLLGVLIFFSSSIYLTASKRPAFLNESCTGRSCLSQLNMKCINKKCSCLPTQYYLKGCHDKKSYLQPCIVNATVCIESGNLVCQDGVCKCTNTNYWNGKMCISKSSYASFCTKNDQCITEAELVCDATRQMCTCLENRFWDGYSCFPKQTLGENCLDTSGCMDWQNLTCSNGLCSYVINLIIFI